MQTTRLEAFSDGVMAILITILVLELKAPHGAEWKDLAPLLPVFGAYVLSFIYLGIYWNNHHHLLHATQHSNGLILWANLHLFFWLSLLPFVTGWMGENHMAELPVLLYGAILLCAGIAYKLLVVAIARDSANSEVRAALGADRKGSLSLGLYAVGILLTFFNVWLGMAMYIGVACMWLVPDRRIEERLHVH